ncbi:hypothetical protein CONPUDRAFT_76378 [Coniophora puteana RWD-64-598 SS2]|uniref:DUF6534 domain-containing protein n=1 Tax=Coniophora puteana (strain RWD-64-598) TaxID=741705 RepID=A0A5M3MCT9_CONPW|nr:uncharacterized protein CONPUDRAFT_76378 [Coniophora puteana RWD-64-598 SS2]EIW76807.1 hypothetical protein CONPUDRAFT_76378 [Coniophora puteana RWD-64-598 SS2]
MATLAAAIPHVDLNPSMGATFVGLIVATTLYGITLVQTGYYFVTFRKDDAVLKWTVGVLTLLDTVALIINCHGFYWYTISNWGNPLVLNIVIWSFTANVFFTNTIAIIVQLYLIRRVYILSQKNWWICAFLLIIPARLTATGFAYGIRLAQLGLNSLIPKILFLIRTSLASTLVVDVLITIALCFYLHRSRTGMSSTDTLINTLIVYTVNTGLLTTLVAFFDVVLHTALDGTLAYYCFYVMLTKLYTNSFLGTLNARRVLRGKAGDVVTTGPSSGPSSMGGTTARHTHESMEISTLPPMEFHKGKMSTRGGDDDDEYYV